MTEKKTSSELACEFCTFINEPNARICNACGRSLGLPSINLNPSGLECLLCTFKNPYGCPNCAMCGSMLVKEEIANSSMDTGSLCPICCCHMFEEFKMPGCSHIFCATCAKQHFTIKIMECGINNFRCPIDVCVSFDELKNKSEFFNDLKLVLLNVLDEKTSGVFVSKVGILDIMDKPGFVRCFSCSHGFISRSKSKMTHCPSCSLSFCSKCGKKWINGHSQTSCSSTTEGMADSDWQMFANASCPKCKYRYILERGGCMHITCSQCSHEYCEFCFKKITGKGKSCDFPKCTKGQSLHGHHPRNCMYYVREMEHTKLEQLLKKNGIRYTMAQSSKTTICNVKVNVSVGDSWVDSECKQQSRQKYNNMCLNHYKWHLGELMKKHNIDPVDAMNNKECTCELHRNNLSVVLHSTSGTTFNHAIEDQYTPTLRTLVRTKIPHERIQQ